MEVNPLTFEAQVAATRRHLAVIKSLRGQELLAAGRTLRAEIAAGRAIPVKQLQALDAAPPRPKMQEAAAALREIVWQAYLDAGLEALLAEWLEDIAEMEGGLRPAGRPQLRVGNAARAGTLLLEHRTAGHPFLEYGDEFDRDHPVWAKDYSPPAGLVFEEPAGGSRPALYETTGSRRVLDLEGTHPGARAEYGYRRWLVLEEVKAYLDLAGI